MYKNGIKEVIQKLVEQMVYHPVGNAGFVDMAAFGVMDIKSLVGAMLIGFIAEVLMEIAEIIFQITFK